MRAFSYFKILRGIYVFVRKPREISAILPSINSTFTLVPIACRCRQAYEERLGGGGTLYPVASCTNLLHKLIVLINYSVLCTYKNSEFYKRNFIMGVANAEINTQKVYA